MTNKQPIYNNQADIIQQFNNSIKIQRFLNRWKDRRGTLRVYRSRLREFFLERQIKNIDDYFKDPDNLVRKKRKEYKNRLKDDIEEHFFYLKNDRKPRLHRPEQFLPAIKGILGRNGITITDPYFWKDLRNNGNGSFPETKPKTPTTEELIHILSYADREATALIKLGATSGLRLGSLLSIDKTHNIELEHNYPRIWIEKTNAKRKKKPINTRTTPEAKKAILEYLEKYDKIVNLREKRTPIHHHYTADRTKLFPMSETTAEEIWNNLCKKAGYYIKDPTTGKTQMNFQSLRRYFKTHFMNYDPYLAKYFMGQSSRVDKHYDDLNEEQIDEHYSKGAKYLIIEQDHEITKTTLEQYDKQIGELKEQVKNKDEKLDILLTRMESLDQELKEFKTTFNDITKLSDTINFLNRDGTIYSHEKPVITRSDGVREPIPMTQREKQYEIAQRNRRINYRLKAIKNKK